MTSRSRFSRRSLLSAMGLAGGYLPLLETSRAFAQPAKPRPKRLVIWACANGVKEAVYWPQGTETDWKIPTDAEVPAAHKYSPLAPLIPHKDKLIFVAGMVIQNGRDTNNGSLAGHGSSPFHLTGGRGAPGPKIMDGIQFSAGNPSVDQYIAKEIAKRDRLPFESLPLRVPPEAAHSIDKHISFYGPPLDRSTPNVPTAREDPVKLFKELFGGGAMGSAELDKLRAKRRSVLDLVGKQLDRFSKNLGTEDRQRVGAHLDGIRSIERQMEFFDKTTKSCAAPNLPTFAANYMTTNGNPYLQELVKAHVDLLVAALACDLTRVSTIIAHNAGNVRVVYPFLGPEFQEKGRDFANAGENMGLRNDHEIAHRDSDPVFMPMKNRVSQWWISQYAYLIDQLRQRKDPDGTPLLDNSAACLMQFQRTGGGHHIDNLPWIIAGSCGGYFKTNRFIPWPSGTRGKNIPQNGVLTALCNAMDCPRDWYGSPDYGGELKLLRG